MKKTRVLAVLTVILVCCVGAAQGDEIFNDGGTHDISWAIHGSVDVRETTTVNVLDGGSISNNLSVYDNSIVNVFGGYIGIFWTDDSSQITFSGGTIGTVIRAGMEPEDESIITFVGSDFTVDGTPVDYGELHSINGGYYYDDPIRHLTGILANGDLLDNNFYVSGDSSIVLTPEPATLLLLGLGAVILRRRKK